MSRHFKSPCLLLFLLLLSHATSTKPNIILIMADDLGYADITPNNPSNPFTPNITRLANVGMRFTDYHSASPVCTPSRAGLLTGRLAQRTGVYHNFGPSSIGGLPQREKTIAHFLKKEGYATGIVGKWHLGITEKFHPLSHGFDTYFGIPFSVDMGCVTDGPVYNVKISPMCGEPTAWHNSIPLYANRDIIQQPVNLNQLTNNYVAFSKAFIREHVYGKQPFFLYVPLAQPHVPLATDPRFHNASRVGHFEDTLMEIDHYVGEILDSVYGLGVSEETLVIFTSDNGPWEYKCGLSGSHFPYVGEYQKATYGGGSTGKMTTWEGGHRVPFIASWPGQIEPGTVSNALSSALDILPSIAEIVGFSLPTDRVFDGVPLSFLKPPSSRTLFIPDTDLQELWAMRWNSYKIYFATNPKPDCNDSIGTGFAYHDPPLVFDLSVDPAESTPLTNLTMDFYRTVDKFRDEIHRSIEQTFHSTVDWSGNPDVIPCCEKTNKWCACSSSEDPLYLNRRKRSSWCGVFLSSIIVTSLLVLILI